MTKIKSICKPATDRSPHLSSLIEPYPVGSGTTKRTQYRKLVEKFGHDTRPPDVTDEEWLKICLDAWNALTPDQHIYDNLENRVRRILVAVGLPAPDTANAIFSIPDGKQLDFDARKAHHGKTGGLVPLIEARGYPERMKIEWYAARILICLLSLKVCIEKKKPNASVMIAFEIGMLTKEMQIRFEYVAENARKGGSHKKRLPVVVSFVRSRLRKNNSLTSSDLWNEVPEGEDDAFKIGKRKKVYRDKERLYFIEMINGHWIRSDQSITFASFRKYVTDARKPVAR